MFERREEKVELQYAVSPLLGDVAAKIRKRSADIWGEDRALEIVGRSAALETCLRRAERFAAFGEPVLLLGESGVGKESMAQAIHLLGPRSRGPFVVANCPQYEDADRTVSELFGHVKGAFTGASSDRPGCFEQAGGGAIFLDEIGDLPAAAQAVMLRALSAGYFRPLGSTAEKKADARVITATNRHLNMLVANDEFRHDLLHRLRSFEVVIPPLRDRGDDWQILLEHYLGKLERRYGLQKRFSEASLRLLQNYSWPGNVRDVIRIVNTGYAMADGSAIEPAHFAECLRKEKIAADEPGGLLEQLLQGQGTFWSLVHDPFLDRELNREQVMQLVEQGLRRAGGSYKSLVKLLGLPQREYQRLMGFLRHNRLKPDRR
jgi:transcriptional regulator with GAF, ATPase, and Fis domain